MTAVTLSAPLAAFVEAQVASGEFADAEAVVAEGLDMLRTEVEAEQARETAFWAEITVGLEQVERGEIIRVEDQTAWLDSLRQGRGDEGA